MHRSSPSAKNLATLGPGRKERLSPQALPGRPKPAILVRTTIAHGRSRSAGWLADH